MRHATDCGTHGSPNLSQETLPPAPDRTTPQTDYSMIFYTMTNPSSTAETHVELEREVARLMVSALNLEVTPESIEADTDLYGDGLGLDSIDILEIALVVSKQYGIQMKTEGDDNFAIFKSLRSLSAYIAEKRTK
jgi:acyl carrier protein